MPLIKTITAGARTIDLHTFTGEVVEEKKWATTQVSGGGGGYNVGSGQQNPVSISSTTTTHDQFFLRNEAGQEKAFEITDARVAVRKGHRVTVLWGIPQGNERGPFLAVCNHTTGDVAAIPSGISALSFVPLPTLILVAYIASILAACLYGLGIIALIALMIYRSKQKTRVREAVQTEVNAAIARIKSQN